MLSVSLSGSDVFSIAVEENTEIAQTILIASEDILSVEALENTAELSRAPPDQLSVDITDYSQIAVAGSAQDAVTISLIEDGLAQVEIATGDTLTFEFQDITDIDTNVSIEDNLIITGQDNAVAGQK